MSERTYPIDLADARETVVELLAMVDDLNKLEVNLKTGQVARAERVRIRRDFRYLEHLTDKLKVAINDEYWSYIEHDENRK